MPPADPPTSSDPLRSARKLAAPVRPKRFYRTVGLIPESDNHVLALDGKRALTPGRNPVAMPHRPLAEAVAAEWAGQGEEIDAGRMPATRLVNSAIDGVAPRRAEVRAAIAAYAETDLLYYRAGEPEGLVAGQRAHWDPLLAWAEAHFGARFVLAEGVMHVPQPERALSAVRRELEAVDDPFRLAGLSVATTLTGSALIALALAAGAIDPDAAWTAAHVDEDWNISQWGADSEAMQRRERRAEEFRAAVLAIGASGP